MAMRNVYKEIKGLKVKEVPAKLKPMLSLDYLKGSFQRGLDNYHQKYILTDSVQPLYHICFGGMIFSYLVALPEERRHLAHQEHAKQHGAPAAH
ncbi:OLC1v1015323C1 [Oldenlandia corymbosa var. corymbosa]|uniref:OLC1v1015323C1 n=1 Tax=Oldenlandia corymbosa var. corymbosa TaxID=529605 RepID=A0AAV1E571_OLDCO|nr:OLC1v1015323C1 [Oldenlandia corymbosa var. corymbosa]